MMTAAPAISGRWSSRLSSVVLPLPKNPVMTATGVRKALCRQRLLFLVRGITPEAREAVHARAVQERGLRRRHVAGGVFVPALLGSRPIVCSRKEQRTFLKAIDRQEMTLAV